MKKVLLCALSVLLLSLTLCSCDMSGDMLSTLIPGNSEQTLPIIGTVPSLPSQTAPTTAPTEAQTTTTVAEKEDVALTLDRYSATMFAGDTLRINATTNATSKLTWTSSNEAVALVNSIGDVIAVGEGYANITCSADNMTAICTVIVKKVKEQPTTTAPTKSPFIFPHSSTSYLTAQEIRETFRSLTIYSPTGKYFQDAINEIFARHGYIFQDPVLQAYYEATSWYRADASYTGDLNEYEKENIALLREVH